MPETVTPQWESLNSQFHARRRACLTCRDVVPDRVATVLVEDDDEVADALIGAFVGQPVEILRCADPAEALLAVGRTCPDAVVLGPATGLMSALEFLAVVRATDEDLPIVVGAGTGTGDFVSRATDFGATAVVRRPYRPRELLGLLRSLAPRPDRLEVRPLAIDLGRLRIDGGMPQFWLDGRTVELPPMEYLLLRYFAERPGTALTRAELINAVWGEGAKDRSNTLTVHIARLRKRLGDDEQRPQWIKAVRGLGYQFTVPAHSANGSPTPGQSPPATHPA